MEVDNGTLSDEFVGILSTPVPIGAVECLVFRCAGEENVVPRRLSSRLYELQLPWHKGAAGNAQATGLVRARE